MSDTCRTWPERTNIPWIDSNGWRFARGIAQGQLRERAGWIRVAAAAEAFVFNVDAIINPDPKDLEDLGKMLRFLKANEQAPLPDLVNIGVVRQSFAPPQRGLNLLTRRNLLYKVVPAPDRTLDLNVQLGTPDFPAEAARNPYEFAARVRAKLGDDKRLVRLYGTSTVIARLTGDKSQRRASICSPSEPAPARRRSASPCGFACCGRYQPRTFASSRRRPRGAAHGRRPSRRTTTEFWVPDFNTCAIIDLEAMK